MSDHLRGATKMVCATAPRQQAPEPTRTILAWLVLADVLTRLTEGTEFSQGSKCWVSRKAMSHGTAVMNHRRLRSTSAGETPRGASQIKVLGLLLEMGQVQMPDVGPHACPVLRCGEPQCINPAHVAPKSRGELIAQGHARRDAASKILHAQRIARARVKFRVLDDALLHRVRHELSTPLKALARETGVAYSTLQAARAGRTYEAFQATPWTGLGDRT